MRATFTLTTLGLCAAALMACPSPTDDGFGEDALHDSTDLSATPAGPDPADQARILSVPLSETWALPGLNQEVHVVRTAAGVPHLYAHGPADLARALGFTVARDRYFVMDLQRRLATGTISALLGDLALGNDVEARLLGMTHVTDRLLEGLSEEDGAFLDAYAEGINAYVEAVADGTLPPPSELEFAAPLLGAAGAAELMAPFDRRAIIAMVTVLMYETTFDMGDIGRDARRRALDSLFADRPEGDLRRMGFKQDLWDPLEPPYTVASTPGWGRWEGAARTAPLPTPSPHAAPPSERPEATPEAAMTRRAIDRAEQITRRLGRQEGAAFGSNTWAVAGSHTTDGFALVAGDGHLPMYVPAIMYQVGLNTTTFGGGDVHQSGLLVTNLPLLGVGTNGHVAWSQVNPVADIVDWYHEALSLDADGLPDGSQFDGSWRPLEEVSESVAVAEVALLGSTGRTETWSRWQTFDGRFIYDVEGREVTDEAPLAEGERTVRLGGRLVVPGDQDGDGVVSAISFDTTAFDVTGYIRTLTAFTRARDVRELQAMTRGLVGNMLYMAAADRHGDILFTAYQGVPCRTYLPRDAGGVWAEGADPTGLIDGSRYGGFQIPTLEDGTVDEQQGDDPSRCVVPFDASPQAVSPPSGYVVNANNQPAPITDDGSLTDDPWYIGGPWSSLRADSITRRIEVALDGGGVDDDTMAAIQGDHRSPLGALFTPALLDALEGAEEVAAQDPGLAPHEARMRDLYLPHQAALTEVRTRLEGWRDAGYPTPSGVETFYHAPTDPERASSVATMVFNAWLPRALGATFDDETMEAVWPYSRGRYRWRALKRLLDGRGADNPRGLASWDPDTGESAFFDDLNTGAIERADEVLLGALVDALGYLASAPVGAGGGFGTDQMDAWLWGLRHQVRLRPTLLDFLPDGSDALATLLSQFAITTEVLPLAPDLPVGDPRRNLDWFPRGGDNHTVDAANPGLSGTSFTHDNGPVMRMVIGLKDGEVRGRNVIPGGQSGRIESPHFADQAALWLANETLPLHFHVRDVVNHAEGREVLTPAP